MTNTQSKNTEVVENLHQPQPQHESQHQPQHHHHPPTTRKT